MTDFALGFEIVGRIALRVAGGITAVMVFFAAVLLVFCIAGALFDWVTNAMAKRWEKKGYKPRGKLERIILENHKRLGL